MALTADYNSRISNQRAVQSYLVDTTKTFYAGMLVQLSNTGYLQPVDPASANKIVGQFVRLTPDGLTAEVREGDITLDNAASGDAIAQANVGASAYATDHATVSDNGDDGGSPAVDRPKAGKIIGITADSKITVRCTLETTL